MEDARSYSKVEELLERYGDAEGWRPLCREGRSEVDWKQLSGSRSLMRSSFVAKVSLEQTIAILRPEAVLCMSSSIFAGALTDARLLKSFGAGDVIGRMQLSHSRHLLLTATARGLKAEAEMEGCYRMVVKRDFGGKDGVAMLAAPLDTQRYELREVLGPHKAMAVFASKEGDFTRITKVMPVEQRFLWTVPLIMRRSYLTAEIVESCALAQPQKSLQLSGFVVLRIRKCCRGPPLLPASWPATPKVHWAPCTDVSSDFQLPVYMQRLLPIIGVRDVEVFDILDGRRLVFYLVALRREDWVRVQDIVEAAMLEQRAAYRRRFGGSSAPFLEVDVAPRFCSAPPDQSDTSSNRELKDESPHEAEWPCDQLPVRNTFIDFPLDRDCDDDLETLSAPGDLC